MPRHFGIRVREDFDRFWNEPTNDKEREPRWPVYALVAAVVLIAGIGILIA